MEREKPDIALQSKRMDHLSTPPASRKSVMDSTDEDGPNPQHRLFCRMVGMPVDFGERPYPSLWNFFSGKEKNYKGLYPRVRAAYQWHTIQYWFVACVSNSMLWLQICFGAVLTALGGVKSDKVSIAIIVLGTIQTIMGGFITYFKSRNQPNRTRQFRIALGRVLDAIENAESLLRDRTYTPPPYIPIPSIPGNHSADGTSAIANAGVTFTGVDGLVLRLMDMYEQATNEAQANYPDFWSTTRRIDDDDHFTMKRQYIDRLKAASSTPFADRGSRIIEGTGEGAVNNMDAPGRLSETHATIIPAGHGGTASSTVTEPVNATTAALEAPVPVATSLDLNTGTNPRDSESTAA